MSRKIQSGETYSITKTGFPPSWIVVERLWDKQGRLVIDCSWREDSSQDIEPIADALHRFDRDSQFSEVRN